MADEWKGWKGTKSWVSVENDFELKATNKGTNAVILAFCLKKNVEEDDDWEFKGNLKIDLGALDKIAKDIASLYQNP